MTIPEPLNTILLVNTLIGLCVSSIAGMFAVTWMMNRLVDKFCTLVQIGRLFHAFLRVRPGFERYKQSLENGWTDGAIIFEDIIQEAMREIPDADARKRFYRPLIWAFQDFDCHNLKRCFGVDPAFDEAFGEPQEEDSDDTYEEDYDDDLEDFMD